MTRITLKDILQETYGLCLDKNIDFLQEKCIWIVTLDDPSNTIIYQDDANPHGQMTNIPSSAWVRLSTYLQDSGDNIKSWKLQFRDNIVDLPVGVGHVYSHGVIGTMLGGQNNTFHQHIVGAIPNEYATEVERFWYHSPALVCTDRKMTKLDDLDPQAIIWNKDGH